MFSLGCSISLVLSFEEFILPGSMMHMVYCINSTRFHRLDISSSFVERLLWTRERVIQSRQNVRIRILAEI